MYWKSTWAGVLTLAFVMATGSLSHAADSAPSSQMDKLLFWAEADPEQGEAPLAVKFSVDLMKVKGENIPNPKYSWDFGDGSAPSTEPNPTHTYTKPGDYDVRVRVTDDEGKMGTFDLDIFVDEAPQPAAKGGAPKNNP